MNGILIILILIILLYFIYQKFRLKIYDKEYYKLGLLRNDYNIKKYGILLKKMVDENIEIVMFEDYDTLMSSLNDKQIDFGITYENYFIDSVLGLNSYDNKYYNNLQFCTALYFNYFQFISNIFIKDKDLSTKFTNLTDLKDFKKIYKRNYILGTENSKSISFINMFILLVVFDYNPINYKKYDENIDYDDNVIFYLIDDEENLKQKMIENRIDGLLLFRTFNDKIINYINKEKDIIFLDINFQETYFDELFSIYFFKNNNVLIGVDDFDDLKEKIGFETRMSRVLLLSNNSVKDEIVYKFMQTIYGHNNYFTNVLTNSNNTLETQHNYFEPIQLAYIDKNLPIHSGSKKYLKELGFIIDKEYIVEALNLKNYEKLKSYWKYKKIGLDNFKI
jgi:TRAP-type uncharacterized transport system substrate-binding protein